MKHIKMPAKGSIKLNILICTLFALLIVNDSLCAQDKPAIIPSSYDHWPILNSTGTKFSYSGNYFAYQIIDKKSGTNKVTFESVDQKWKSTFNSVHSFEITNLGSKEIGLILIKDSLWIITLGTKKVLLKTNVRNVTVSQPNGQEAYSVLKSQWILVNKKDKSTELINTKSENSLLFDSVEQTLFLRNNETPIIKSNTFLLRINQTLKVDTIYKFSSDQEILTRAIYSIAAQKFFILVYTPKQSKIVEIGKTSNILICDENIPGKFDMKLDPYSLSIADHDSTIIFNLLPQLNLKTNATDTSVTSLVIWSHLDNKISLNSDEVNGKDLKITYAYNIFKSELHPLENDSLVLTGTPSGEWAIINSRAQFEDPAGTLLKNKILEPIQLISVKGKGIIRPGIMRSTIRGMSPLTKNIVYLKDSTIFVFNTGNQTHYPILKVHNHTELETNEPPTVSIAGWSLDNDTVYLYSNYDILMVSCENKFPIINLTSGYGASNKIQFFLRTGQFDNKIQYADLKFLPAIDKKTMQHGFFSIYPGTNKKPTKLNFGPFYYVHIQQLSVLGSTPIQFPIKSRGSDRYIVTRSTVNQAPNLFFTKDFKHLTQLTFVKPEAKYNWMKSELIQYYLPNNIKINGILYKPENYDSTKKYPLIISSYQEQSQALNGYIEPQDLCTSCLPNITTYVSNGYMVFVPDIYRPQGNTFMGATETILGALEKLSKIRQIDMDHVGIVGCSFSGTTTEFILTKVKAFKAAVISSALANPISGFNMLTQSGLNSLWYQRGQGNFGVSLYENPQLYIDNAAILKVNKIETPILLMHTTNDDRCPIYDAIQFFVALRNQNKKVWLLEYKKGIHGVYGNDAPDFSMRMRQFFDHYLKEMPAPLWMTSKTKDPWSTIKNNQNLPLVNQQQGNTHLSH
ncbi:Prolyl oligopeptidase family protein [Chitinophaga jiangningensis]|uniref:Prolyl oligopeptidase family protein n=1 Tax=Chitinophaga jiangningensis TaxID=1419482 RepID=A0A1M7BUM7_9BACT|nr:prolyl oligopeptidase family serine peptidase [Chitinophaga jiangningensis]SHL58748.1 Prolyl oligopeptidase family protein [Chitinophaga jiangningensis]